MPLAQVWYLHQMAPQRTRGHYALAFVTLAFLPAPFVYTVFNMSFFNFGPGDRRLIFPSAANADAYQSPDNVFRRSSHHGQWQTAVSSVS
ncbi:hypothetical protein MAPG_07347 [Magnaporthiopsis poae ATCC 64411]|uniref:Uncharacterized protein n=1 Tax=Magnaporthiopsis poae (strain ATCC 64411 / 73-15) TaxID=644358 RepID=A0A0C4E4F4_MAGP6|nr:hypothetical protein MAPG_07347 [Magnaporthiopsis poae ATCC 64411]